MLYHLGNHLLGSFIETMLSPNLLFDKLIVTVSVSVETSFYWNQYTFRSIPFKFCNKWSFIIELQRATFNVTPATASFLKEYGPMMLPASEAHHRVSI